MKTEKQEKQKEKLADELRLSSRAEFRRNEGKDEHSSSPFADARVFEQEGQLAVDIYQTENKLIIQTAIAGVKQEDLDIAIEKDLITIRGKREEPIIQKNESEKKDYFVQECYWGPFSRKIVLPVEINPDNVEASMKDGILVIQLIKVLREKKRKIEIK